MEKRDEKDQQTTSYSKVTETDPSLVNFLEFFFIIDKHLKQEA